MDRTVADIAFRAMLASYEDGGWEVRTLDTTGMRAIVRTDKQAPSVQGIEPVVSAPVRLPACRKLWVDAAGDVQETNVPC
jgi:hypothetical protein